MVGRFGVRYEFCTLNDGFCFTNDNFCIINDDFCIINDDFCIINDEYDAVDALEKLGMFCTLFILFCTIFILFCSMFVLTLLSWINRASQAPRFFQIRSDHISLHEQGAEVINRGNTNNAMITLQWLLECFRDCGRFPRIWNEIWG